MTIDSRSDAGKSEGGGGLGGFSFQRVDGQEIGGDPAELLPPSVRNSPADARAARNLALAAAFAYVAYSLLLPLVPYHPRLVHSELELFARLAAFHVAPTAVFMLLQLWLARSLVGLRWNNRQCGIAVASAVFVWVAVTLIGGAHYSRITRFGVEAYNMLSPLASSLALTAGLTALGVMLSRIVREPNVLLPVALVAMPIDYVGAMTSVGFTSNVVKHAPDIVSRVSVHVPHLTGIHIYALIGPGDALFIAFFLAAVQRLEMNLRGTFWWMFGLLTAAIVTVLLTGFPIAALVPMGVAMIAANWRYFHLKRAEVFAVLYAACIIFVLVGVFYLLSARHFGR